VNWIQLVKQNVAKVSSVENSLRFDDGLVAYQLDQGHLVVLEWTELYFLRQIASKVAAGVVRVNGSITGRM